MFEGKIVGRKKLQTENIKNQSENPIVEENKKKTVSKNGRRTFWVQKRLISNCQIPKSQRSLVQGKKFSKS